ncbi:MAG: hypothetical protein V9H69_16635 [Anaerolineae bacterium]
MTHKTPPRPARSETPPASPHAAIPARRQSSLTLALLPALLIVAGLLLLLAGQARSDAGQKTGAAALAPTVAGVEPAPDWAAAPASCQRQSWQPRRRPRSQHPRLRARVSKPIVCGRTTR